MRHINLERHRFSDTRTGRTAIAAFGLAVFLGVLLGPAATAFAGRSSTGTLAFYPCTRCHPVTEDAQGNPSHPLPNGFKKHDIKLEVHTILGAGDTACLACHDDPSRNPGMLKLADGSLVPVNGDISRVCQRCHFEKYREWQQGVHGKHKPSCSAAGCHDPHSPSWIYVGPLKVVQATGFEADAVGPDRKPFKPFAPPPVPPAVFTPLWLVIATIFGAATVLGIGSLMVFGRSKR